MQTNTAYILTITFFHDCEFSFSFDKTFIVFDDVFLFYSSLFTIHTHLLKYFIYQLGICNIIYTQGSDVTVTKSFHMSNFGTKIKEKKMTEKLQKPK